MAASSAVSGAVKLNSILFREFVTARLAERKFRREISLNQNGAALQFAAHSAIRM